MSAKRVSVKEMKHDGLVEAVASTATFLERHRLLLIVLATVVVGVAVVIGWISYREASHRAAAARLLSEAQGREELQAVYGSYPDTPSAPLALIQAGALSFSEGDYAAARNSYRLFEERYPEHPLADFAQMGIAASLEAEGRWNEAVEAYRLLIVRYPDSARVPEAAFGQGRCWREADRPAEAREAFRQVYRQFQQSPYARLAREEEVALEYPPPE